MTVRALFWEETYAALVASRLQSDGFTAERGRERFAGEDDDEDHAWVVVTDAPAVMAPPNTYASRADPNTCGMLTRPWRASTSWLM